MKKIRSFYPTLKMAWVIIVVWLACSFFCGVLVAVAGLFTGEDLLKNSWVMLAVYVLPFLLTAGVIYLMQRYAEGEAAQPRKPFPEMLFLLLLVFTPLLAFTIEPLTAWLPMPEVLQETFGSLFQLNVPAFLMTVIAAPLCEEWLCRGVIARGLLKHSTPTKAILWSAFIFAVLHLNPWQAVPAFALGLLLGYVYWKTRSLAPCIFIHLVNNGLSYLLMYCFPEIDMNAGTQELLGSYYWPLYAVALPLTALAGLALWKVLKKN